MLKVYVYKGCDTCRKALKWLEAREIAHQTIPIREQPPSLAELEQMLTAYGENIRKLFNTSGQDYKAMDLKTKLPQMQRADALKLLAKNGNLVKRPFAVSEQGKVVGFDEEEWRRLFLSNRR